MDEARAAIFDMDGVLIDSAEAQYASWKQVCTELGRDLTFAQFQPSMGTGNDVTVRILLGDEAAGRFEEIAARKEAIFRRLVRENPKYINGAAELVQSLHDAGWRLALATSAPAENVACALEAFPAGPLLSVRVDADMVAHAKPEPDLFLKAAELVGVAPCRCVVIEDSIAGLKAAERAGMARVALTTTLDLAELAVHSDLVVDSLRDLTPGILSEIVSEHGAG